MPPASQPAKRMAQLREEINRHNHLYYTEARPQISDRDYDRLMQELIDLEKANPDLVTPDSPTQRIGEEPLESLKSVKHAVPMMSIDNTYSEDEVRAFDERVRKILMAGAKPIAYVLEPKIDGTSISLRYENGLLVLAATRGRGNVGDDVTVNARTINSIPLRLTPDGKPIPAVLEVRGEVYMDNEDFQRVNREIEADGEEPYANPRNLTSGTLRRLDPRIVARRRLRFLAHGVGQVEPMPATSYWEWTQLLRAWSLPLPTEVWRVDGVDNAIKGIHEFEKIRPKLPYMTDGMVMKVDDFALRDKLGATSKSPRWLIAYKYETEQQPTVLNAVRWQVGRTGQLTPVGLLEPVFISGVTVSNVTLHNIDQIHRLDLHLGDTIVIERSGEVIPYVVEVQKEKRPRGAKSIEAPTKCPDCDTRLVREALPEEQAAYRCINTECDRFFERKKVKRYKLPSCCPKCGQNVEVLDAGIEILCPNESCPGRIKESIRYFCGRSQMDIEGLGDVLVDQLVDRGLVRTFADLFYLKADQLSDLTHETQIGTKKANALVKLIEASRPQWPEFQELLEAASIGSLKSQLRWLADPKRLDIRGLGEKTIEQLVNVDLVKAPEDLFKLKADQIAELPQTVRLGATAAASIVEQIDRAKDRGLARLLAALGIPKVGTTVARSFAEWGRDIETLKAASVEELASVLARDPEAKKTQTERERYFAQLLAKSLHRPADRSLFDAPMPSVRSSISEESTEKFLTRRDAAVSRDQRLGKSRIRSLSERFPRVPDLERANVEAIFDCLLEGVAVARSLFDYLHSATGNEVLRSLRDAGVKLSEQEVRRVPSKWTGKAFVITGSFDGFTRDAIKKRLITLGASVTDSVSSKTDGVFVGVDPGSKLQKAMALGIQLYDEKEVRRLMQSS